MTKKVKRISVVLVVLVAAGLLYWYGPAIYEYFQTASGKATELVDNMKSAKENYEKNKGTSEASEAVQEIQQAIFEGDKYLEDLKANNDAETVKEFEEIFNPVRQELQAIVEDEE